MTFSCNRFMGTTSDEMPLGAIRRVFIRKVFTENDTFGHLSVRVGFKDRTVPASRLVPCCLCFCLISNDRCRFRKGV